MATLFTKRQTRQFGIEQESNKKLQTLATKMKVHPTWLVMQMSEMLLDDPSTLFNYLAQKIKRTGY